MPSKSKIKGNNFELKISKLLTRIYNESFTRTPNSGAMTGGKNNNNNYSSDQVLFFRSDIMPPNNKWKNFSCECKSYKKFSDSLLEDWINQITINNDLNIFNFIIYNINYEGMKIVFDFKEEKYFNLKNLKIRIYPYENSRWIICESLNEFFKYNKDSFKNRCQNVNKMTLFDNFS